MIKLKNIIFESENDGYVYRGTTSHGNVNLGKQSGSVQDKLVATLGPNYTDNKEIAMIFKRGAGKGGKLLKKKFTGKVLELNDYNDVVRLYAQYKDQLSPGIVNKIKHSEGQTQLQYIQSTGKELRTVLKNKGYKWVKTPFAVSDASNFAKRGLTGDILIDLSFN